MNVARPRQAENQAPINFGERAWTKGSGLKIRFGAEATKNVFPFHDTGFEFAPTSVEARDDLLTRDRILVTQAIE
jgi:hypothetical protein